MHPMIHWIPISRDWVCGRSSLVCVVAYGVGCLWVGGELKWVMGNGKCVPLADSMYCVAIQASYVYHKLTNTHTRIKTSTHIHTHTPSRTCNFPETQTAHLHSPDWHMRQCRVWLHTTHRRVCPFVCMCMGVWMCVIMGVYEGVCTPSC